MSQTLELFNSTPSLFIGIITGSNSPHTSRFVPSITLCTIIKVRLPCIASLFSRMTIVSFPYRKKLPMKYQFVACSERIFTLIEDTHVRWLLFPLRWILRTPKHSSSRERPPLPRPLPNRPSSDSSYVPRVAST